MKKKLTTLNKAITLSTLYMGVIIILTLIPVIFVAYRIDSLEENKYNILTINEALVDLEKEKDESIFNIVCNYSQSSTDLDLYFENFSTKKTYFIETINKFLSNPLISNSNLIQEITSKLRSRVDSLETLYSEILYYYKERGNLTFGLVSNWVSRSKNLFEQLSALTIEDSEKLEFLQMNYLLTGDKNSIVQINNILFNARMIFDTLTITDEIPINIGEEIANIHELTLKVINVNDKIGNDIKTGLLASLNSAFENLFNSYDKLENNVNDRIANRKNTYTNIIILLIVIFFTICIMYYRSRFKKLLLNPYSIINDQILQLTQGNISSFDDKKIASQKEFKDLFSNLKLVHGDLKKKIEFAAELVSGNLESQLELSNDNDLLGKELLKIQEYIKKTASEREKIDEENEKRTYINEGLAKFAEISHSGTNDIKELTDIFIRQLTKYTNSIQGGIFIIEEENNKTYLEQSSAFAYNRKKYDQKRLQIGEGLVGSCVLEKKIKNLTEIPEDYINITSGLGDAPPSNILIIPMLKELEVVGVIEIASLNKYKDYEIDFLQQAANNIASIISTAKINEQTARLLERSQQQAIGMAEQEEEMRQNMEELQATQEEAIRREEEYSGFIKAFDNAFMFAEFDLDGNIIKANEKYLVFLGLTNDEIAGGGYKDLIALGDTKVINNEFWVKLRNGESQSFIDHVKIGKKKLYDLKQYFMPVSNKDDVPIKILNIAFDITQFL